jgi:hypothetical protein
MSYISIYNQKLAGYLLMLGCSLISIRQNLKKPEFRVFVFRENQFLKEKMSEWISGRAI